jgi:hypothetical protein
MDWFSLLAFNILPIALLSVLNLQLVFTLRQIVRRDSSASSTFGQSTEQENNSHTNFQQQVRTKLGSELSNKQTQKNRSKIGAALWRETNVPAA